MKFTYLLLLVCLLACTPKEPASDKTVAGEPEKPVTAIPAEEMPATAVPAMVAEPSGNFSYRVISAENGTFGYEIINNGNPLIRQLTRPGLPGNNGFTTRQQAEKVAALVIEKLKAGQMPPTITVEEMEALGAR